MLSSLRHPPRVLISSTQCSRVLSTTAIVLRDAQSKSRGRRSSGATALWPSQSSSPGAASSTRRKGGAPGTSFKSKYRPAWKATNRSAASSSSDIALPVLLDKLESQLKKSWRKGNNSIRVVARDLGLDENECIRLAEVFAKDTLQDLRERRLRLEQGDEQVDGAQARIDWDLQRLRSTYINEGVSSVQSACLRMFVLWAARQPLPPPVVATGPRTPAIIASLTLSKLHRLAQVTDRRYPGEAYPSSRAYRRKLILHVGPTNSGKTHSALVALARARTGAYAGPLRLLAHEVFARLNGGKIGDEGKVACNLVTGEEQRIVDVDAGLTSCTVEMFPMAQQLDVGVVDEIQMIGDAQRGTAWTDVVLGANCAELHLCGEESVVELIQGIAAELGDDCIIKRYSRLSPLVVADDSLGGNLAKIRKGDCLVTFSRSNIFAFKRSIEEKTGLKVAVAYGGLPPEVREEQARMFNEGAYDVLVASDAVGMGLNLKVRRIVFESVHKWDGKSEIQLPTPQIKQIAGRAGRYGVHVPSTPSGPDDTPASDVVGEATCLDKADMDILREAMATPTIKITQASLGAQSDTFRDVQALLPAKTPFSKIFRLVEILARTNSRLFSVASVHGANQISDAIEHIEPLSCDERLLFGNAPVNLRDANVVGALVHFVESFAAGRPVMMERWKHESGVQNALDLVEDARALRPASNSSKSAPSVDQGIASTVYTPQFLMKLESLHRCLTLYLWLSYRQWAIFQDRDNARVLRKGVEAAIDFVLSSVKFERVSRGSQQKRNKARISPLADAAFVELFGKNNRPEAAGRS